MRTLTLTTTNTDSDFFALLLADYEDSCADEPIIPADDYDPFEDSRIDLDTVRAMRIAEKYGK